MPLATRRGHHRGKLPTIGENDMSNTLNCSACGAENLASECILGEWGAGTLFCRCRYCGITWHATTDCLDDIHADFDDTHERIDPEDVPVPENDTKVWVTPEGPEDPRNPLINKGNK